MAMDGTTRTDLMPLGANPRPDEVVEMIIGRLEKEANDRVFKRQIVEQRWIADMTQYEGRYDPSEEATLDQGGGSTAFVNKTRSKVSALESKLYDMLFPTDDRNWAIEPTPVPELASDARKAVERADLLTDEANIAKAEEDAKALRMAAQQAADVAARAKAVMDEAKNRAMAMSDEIADHFVECDYQAECRDVLHDGCLLGTGILKGPLPRTERIRRNWLKNDRGEHELQFGEGADRLVYHRVNPWSLFPDTTAMSFDEVESFYERHILPARDLRRFAKLPNVNLDALEEILEEGPQDTVPNYIDQVQSISEEKQNADRQRYIMWEYRGPLEREEMQALCAASSMEDEMPEEISPLYEIDCVIWFSQGKLLKFGINHMDSNSAIYSFFMLEKNEARLWGVGIPWIMRQPQAIVNSAWRLMLDNAALGAHPQVEVDMSVIQPSEGDDYGIRARKTWLRMENADPGKPGLTFHEIPMQQPMLAAIIEMAKGFIDEETSISVLASGEQGATTKTAGGMALLMNSVNVVFRRIVKNFDDGITEPSLERAYDYLMQFSGKEEIKGDYQVMARGSSVLLVREIQAQNLMLLAMQATQHPVLGSFFKVPDLLRKMLQSMMIAADDVLKTEDEIAEEAADEAQSGAPDPEIIKLTLQQNIARSNAEVSMAEIELKRELAMIDRETQILKLASDREMKIEDVAARLQAIREQSATRLAAAREQGASKERIMAAEIAVEATRPPGVAGSGGYI